MNQCSPYLNPLPKFLCQTNKLQHRSLNQKKSSRRNTTITSAPYPVDNHNQQESVKKEDSVNFIPTIINGITKKTTISEMTLEVSELSSEVNGDTIHGIMTDLKESINIHQNKKLPSTQHRVVLSGDSNMRGYVSSLEPLLNSNYNLYSVMKPGSSTNELGKSATETISYLNHNDMIILCYGTNNFDQKSKKNLKEKLSCTFQNIKKFILNNNHTNILLMNVPFQYDIPNVSLC